MTFLGGKESNKVKLIEDFYLKSNQIKLIGEAATLASRKIAVEVLRSIFTKPCQQQIGCNFFNFAIFMNVCIL